MGIFDRALGAIAPGWAVARARNKMLLQAYDAARPSRLNKTKRESRAADTAVGVAGVSLREQARALDEDHDIVIGLLDKLEERVIGAQGFRLNRSHWGWTENCMKNLRQRFPRSGPNGQFARK